MLPLGLVNEYLKKINNWALEESSIVKDFNFKSFRDALEFVNKVGEIAEKENHHPDIVISYNKVRLTLTTHSEHGLTSKDFDVAKEIDKL